MRIEELRDAGLNELHHLYGEGEVPDEDAVSGDMEGEVLAGRGPARTSAWRRLSRLSPWAGMRVNDDDGVNHLGYRPLVFERYGFEKYVERDRNVGALVLDYDVPDNPYALRRLVERVREVDGVYLGKAYLRVGGREVFLHYYAMEPVEAEIPIRS